MKNLLFILMIGFFSTLVVASPVDVGDGYSGYSENIITDAAGLIGSGDTSIIGVTDSKSYQENNILQTKPMPTLDADKTGAGVIYTTGLDCSQPRHRLTLDEVGWRISV